MAASTRSSLCIFLALLSLSSAQDCNSICCILGGTCGDPVTETCVDGQWRYDIRCSPTYKTCCLPNKLPTEPPVGSTSTESPVLTTTDVPGNVTVPGNNTEECGAGPHLRGNNFYTGEVDTHIVGGVEAVKNSWPWLISLEFDFFGWNDWKHHCTASLLNKEWVLTAAHCIVKSGAPYPKNYRVVVGKHATSPTERVTGFEEIIPVQQFVVHEMYQPRVKGAPYDMALIKLAYPIEYTKQVSPICLPPSTNEEFTGSDNCYIIGFGLTKGLGQEGVLNESPIKVITNKLCDDKWEKGSGRVNLIQPEHICAGNGIPGTCNGDSGGPLVCERNGVWVQAGATSFGAAGCTAQNAPDVYTRVSLFNEWIKEKIRITV